MPQRGSLTNRSHGIKISPTLTSETGTPRTCKGKPESLTSRTPQQDSSQGSQGLCCEEEEEDDCDDDDDDDEEQEDQEADEEEDGKEEEEDAAPPYLPHRGPCSTQAGAQIRVCEQQGSWVGAEIAAKDMPPMAALTCV